MNRIKSVVLLIYISLNLSVYAQTNDTLLTKSAAINLSVAKFNTTGHTFRLKSLKIPKRKTTISVYNKTTNLYDNYLENRNGYIYSNSNIIFETKSNFLIDLFMGNNSFNQNNSLMQNHYMLDVHSTYRVRDSFNPHGASNIREALVGGFLGLLFD